VSHQLELPGEWSRKQWGKGLWHWRRSYDGRTGAISACGGFRRGADASIDRADMPEDLGRVCVRCRRFFGEAQAREAARAAVR
jgi:hypothetical protein